VEFFLQQHTFVYIQHMPLWQVLLSHSVRSSGARHCETSTHGEPLLAILLMIFMTTGAKQLGVRLD